LSEEKKETRRDFEIVPVEDVSKMTIEEAVEKGLLPTPIEMAKTTDEVVEYGTQSGKLYGSALASIWSAIRRADLPREVRIAKGVRGLMYIMGLITSAVDTFNQIRQLEDEVLIRKGKVLPDVDVNALIKELERLKKENEELKKKLGKGKKKKEKA